MRSCSSDEFPQIWSSYREFQAAWEDAEGESETSVASTSLPSLRQTLNVYWFSVMLRVALATGRMSAKEAEAEDATPAARKATKEKE